MEQTVDSHQKARPLWPWVVTAVVVLLAAGAFSFWWPMHRSKKVIAAIRSRRCLFDFETDRPRWASFLSEETFHPWFDRVNEIEIYGESVDDAFVKDILVFSELKTLRLNVSEVSPDCIRSIGELEKLESLILEGDGSTIPLDWIVRLKTLDYLHLTHMSVAEDDWQKVTEAELSISDLWFEQFDLGEMEGEACASLTSLSELVIIDCEASQKFWEALSKNQSIKYLHLGDLVIDELSMQALCRLSSLAFFKIWQNVDLDADQVRQLAELKDLREIEFEECRLPDDESWMVLSSLPNLQYITLAETNVGDSTALALAECSELIEVTLYGTELTDAGLERLQKLPKLRLISVGKSKVTPQGIRKFQKSRPDVEISPDPDELAQQIEDRRILERSVGAE